MNYSTELILRIIAGVCIAADLGMIVAVIAAKKGYSFFRWWLYGLAFPISIFVAVYRKKVGIPGKNEVKLIEFVSKNAIILVLVGLVALFGEISPNFLVIGNIINILMISSVRLIIALGEGPILLTKGVDLSAGRTVGLTAVICASLLQRPDYVSRMYETLPILPVLVPIAIALAVGLVVGLVNGTIVAYLKVPPLITTLGTMTAVLGAASLYVDRPPHGAMPIGGLRDDYTQIGTDAIQIYGDLRIPYLLLIAGLVFLIMWIYLNKTRTGKNIYAVGSNPDAAIVSGVNTNRTIISVYVVAGMLYGLAGALLAARTGGATNNYGNMYELDAIAACVIGGVSTNGGVGTVGGILTGVLIFEVLNNGLVVLGMSAYIQMIVKGAIIVLAVAIDIRKYLRKR